MVDAVVLSEVGGGEVRATPITLLTEGTPSKGPPLPLVVVADSLGIAASLVEGTAQNPLLAVLQRTPAYAPTASAFPPPVGAALTLPSTEVKVGMGANASCHDTAAMVVVAT